MADQPWKQAVGAHDGANHARPRSSIVDVAALAGVSRQTVSNVLNGRRRYFSEETYAKVIAAMRTLAYQPNRAAQSLRSRRTMQVGYHMSAEQLDVVNGFTLSFLQALVKAAARDGYHVVVLTHHEDPLAVFREVIARRSVDAFIISESMVDDPRARLLAEHRVPFTSFGRTAPDLPQAWVDIDNAAGMRQLVDYLVGAGHRRFAYLGAEGGEYWKRERLDGFVTGLAAHGIQVPDNCVAHGSDVEIRDHVRRIARQRSRPTVIVTSSDAVAAVVLNVSHALGLRVGRDIAVTGFDGGAIGLFTEPTLTSIRIPVEQIARLLLDRCQQEMVIGPSGHPGVLVPTEIVRGGSA